MANPKAFFEVLHHYDVDHVVVGQLAVALHGIPVIAESIEIFPKCERENNEKLAAALRSMDGAIELRHGTGDAEITADLLEAGWTQLPAGRGHRFSTIYGLADIVYLPEGLE